MTPAAIESAILAALRHGPGNFLGEPYEISRQRFVEFEGSINLTVLVDAVMKAGAGK